MPTYFPALSQSDLISTSSATHASTVESAAAVKVKLSLAAAFTTICVPSHA